MFTFILINLGCLVIFIIKGINPLKNKLELKIGNNNNDLNNLENKDIIVNNKIDIYKNKIDKNNDNKDNKLNALNPPRRRSKDQSNKELIDINNGNNNRIFYFDYIHNNTNIKNIFENNLKNI